MRDSREQASEKEENRRKLDRKGNSKPNHHRRKEREHDPNMINQIKEDEFEAKSKSSFTTKQTDENVIKKLADDVSGLYILRIVFFYKFETKILF